MKAIKALSMLDISASILVEWLWNSGIKNYHANKKINFPLPKHIILLFNLRVNIMLSCPWVAFCMELSYFHAILSGSSLAQCPFFSYILRRILTFSDYGRITKAVYFQHITATSTLLLLFSYFVLRILPKVQIIVKQNTFVLPLILTSSFKCKVKNVMNFTFLASSFSLLSIFRQI